VPQNIQSDLDDPKAAAEKELFSLVMQAKYKNSNKTIPIRT
jgi:hypothetical protein